MYENVWESVWVCMDTCMSIYVGRGVLHLPTMPLLSLELETGDLIVINFPH